MKYKPKTKEWFLKRIGKKIYRDHIECQCMTCTENEKNGLIVSDKNHAEYLYIINDDFASEGIKINYRDKK